MSLGDIIRACSCLLFTNCIQEPATAQTPACRAGIILNCGTYTWFYGAGSVMWFGMLLCWLGKVQPDNSGTWSATRRVLLCPFAGRTMLWDAVRAYKAKQELQHPWE